MEYKKRHRLLACRLLLAALIVKLAATATAGSYLTWDSGYGSTAAVAGSQGSRTTSSGSNSYVSAKSSSEITEGGSVQGGCPQ